LPDNSDAVRTNDFRVLLELTLTSAPAVHQAYFRADRFFSGKRESVKDADQHKLSVSFLAHIIT